MTHLKVIIRVRPLSQRETENASVPVVEIQNNNVVAITNIKVPESNTGDSRQRVRRFTFDYCFPQDSTQDDIFSKVEDVVGRSIRRRNHSCVLAYGQSATGKTHTMMGFPHDPGLTPRLGRKIFENLRETAIENEIGNTKTTVSYLEIYNEKVRDLLAADDGTSEKLRVREHPKKGPYVQGLIEKNVENSDDLLKWISKGNENRRVASTLSNPKSSRSHSVITITCDGVRLYLVDLAGSERAGNKFYTVSRFREGASINKSLVALGNVISALADPSASCKLKLSRKKFVPYRDSVLTWLLKDTFGGNSNTLLIATISPSSSCYSETVNTLRFGQRATLVVNTPITIEDPKERVIRELRLEIASLRKLLDHRNIIIPPAQLETSNTEIDPPSQQSNVQVAPDENHSKTELKYEELIPVMNVKTSVSEETKATKKIPKFRRTASVDFVHTPSMNSSRASSFGSQESLSSKPPKTSNPSKLSKTPKNSSNPSIRRRSIDKSSLSALMKRNSIPEKLEKSVETDSTKAVKPKVDSHRKTVPKPIRSDIVANVTKRLYLKSKNRDAGTDMEGFNDMKNEEQQLPKELTICSNARLRLKELTQKALRAHKFKQAETQTETIVLRVKEISTDVNDLKETIPEVRHVETCTDETGKCEASIQCDFKPEISAVEQQFETRGVQCDFRREIFAAEQFETRGVQCDVSEIECRNEPRVSFTKYLQEPQSNLPIYANSVNINVNHHYPNGKLDGTCSDLNNSSNNMIFPTPDLISNHNSLDPATVNSVNNEICLNFASETLEENLELNTDPFSCEVQELKHAFALNLAKIDGFSKVEMPQQTFAVEVVKKEKYESCRNLKSNIPELHKAKLIDYRAEPIYESFTIYEPKSLKSCIKINNNFDQVPDSLELHKKRVRFSAKSGISPECKKNEMYETMSKFLNEATILMNNIRKSAETEYDLEVTLKNFEFMNRKNTETETQTQTDSTQFESVPTQCNDYEEANFVLPPNKFDSLLKDSCKKLEYRLFNVRNVKNRNLDSFPSFSDSSLDNHSSRASCSDYGSYKSRFVRNNWPNSNYNHCSPSAFLRQLTRMRKQIIESSKEELLNEEFTTGRSSLV